MWTLVLIVLGLAFFFSMMAFAIALPLRPQIVRVTERLVCPTGTSMEVITAKLSYHRPGERGLVVTCQGQGPVAYVNAKAFVYLWLIFFACSLPLAIAAGLLVQGWFF